MLSMTIAGSAVTFDEDKFELIRKVNERWELKCTLLDYAGTLILNYQERIVATDSVLGVIFSGFLIDDKQSKQSIGVVDPTIEHQIDTIDARILADNRTTSRSYITPVFTGKIILDFWHDALAAEGINAYAAMRYENNNATFSQGTLIGTAASPDTTVGTTTTNGYLELSLAGSTVTITENTTAEFATGTLTNMTATGNALVPTTVNALKMQSTLSFAYGVEFAQAQQTGSGTASGTATGTVSGTATGQAGGFVNSYTPSGNITISSGSPGESASFSGNNTPIDMTGANQLSVSAPFSAPVSAGFSTPVNTTVSQTYQPKTKSKVTVDSTHHAVVTVDVAVADNRVDAEIWTGSFTVASNDTLNYDIWIASTSPSQEGGVDLFFSDGTVLTEYLGSLDNNTDVGIWDQNGLSVSPIQDLSDAAKDTWYTRQINLGPLSGKTITAVSVFNAANVAGNFDLYIKNCYLGSQSGSPFFGTSATAPAVNPPVLSSIGAYVTAATLVTVAPVYVPTASSRVSGAYSIDACKLIESSVITWIATNPVVGPGVIPGSQGAATVACSESIFVSYDGTTWLPCSNGAVLPGLPPGANVSGGSLYLMEMFSGGQDPTAIPSLKQVTITLTSAVKATTTDVVSEFGTSTAWNTGTELGTAPNSNGDLALGSTSYSWSNLNNMTWAPGNNSASNPTQSTSSGAYVISTASTGAFASAWSATRFNFISACQNFTANADFTLTGGSSATQNEIGFTYRQTYWGSPNNCFAYYVRIMQNPGGTAGGTSVSLGYGINNPPSSNVGGGPSTAAFKLITQVAETISNGTTYHVKLVVEQNRHTIYWNNGTTPIIDVLDNTYTAAGNIGVRTYLVSGSSATVKIANFTVTNTFAGLWTSPAISLSSLGTVQNTQISWSEINSTGSTQSTAMVMASLNGGTSWLQCTNGAVSSTAIIPGLPVGTNVSGKSLTIQIILSATAQLTAPIITGLCIHVCGGFPGASGTRTTAPAGNDMSITRTSGSTFGNAFDGQPWAKVGTATAATGSGVATLTNTTGNVFELLGTTTLGDCEDTDLVQLSASTISAGLVLRYVDSSHYYYLALSTTALSIVKNIGAGDITIASTPGTYSTGTGYRMRFRAVGIAPTVLEGKVWPVNTLEPGVNLGILSATNPQWGVVGSD